MIWDANAATKSEIPVIATTEAQTFPAWRDLPRTFLDNPTSVLVMVIGALYTILKLRRRASRDNVEVVKDRAESDLIQNLTKDREVLITDRDAALAEARRAWTAHNEVSVENARIKSENFYQQQEIERLKTIVNDMQDTFTREQVRWEEERRRLDDRFEEVKARLQALSKGATGHSGLMPLVDLDQQNRWNGNDS